MPSMSPAPVKQLIFQCLDDRFRCLLTTWTLASDQTLTDLSVTMYCICFFVFQNFRITKTRQVTMRRLLPHTANQNTIKTIADATRGSVDLSSLRCQSCCHILQGKSIAFFLFIVLCDCSARCFRLLLFGCRAHRRSIRVNGPCMGVEEFT